MKRLLAVIITVVMLLTFSLSVFAETAPVKVEPKGNVEIQALKTSLEGLRTQAEAIFEQFKVKRETIKGLIAADKLSKAVVKLKAAKAVGGAIKAVQAEIKSLRDAKQALWAEVKAARTAKDIQTVKAKLAQIVQQKTLIIAKLNQKLTLLDQMIAALK